MNLHEAEGDQMDWQCELPERKERVHNKVLVNSKYFGQKHLLTCFSVYKCH